MTKYFKNSPCPENYTRPEPPPCPPPPPRREFKCTIFGFTESKESINKREEYLKNKDNSIPYDIIGNGIMTADANEVRRVAKHQFDACHNYFNKQQESQMDNEKQFAIEVLKEAIKICEEYSIEKYKLYKSGYDNYHEGMSDGADACALRIEELLAHIMEEQSSHVD